MLTPAELYRLRISFSVGMSLSSILPLPSASAKAAPRFTASPSRIWQISFGASAFSISIDTACRRTAEFSRDVKSHPSFSYPPIAYSTFLPSHSRCTDHRHSSRGLVSMPYLPASEQKEKTEQVRFRRRVFE